jgi:hypothetical protein
MGGRHDKVASTIAGVAVGGLLGHMIGDAAAPHEAPYGAAQIGSAPRAYGSPYGTAPAYENGGGLHHADGGRNRTAPAYENGGFTPDPAPSYGNGYAPGGYYGNADGYAQGAGYRQPSFGQQQDLQRRLAFAPLGTQVRYEASNGDVGIYTPIREGRTRDGRFCREYQGAVTKADGEQINGFGSARRNPNGSWQVISAADTRRDSDFAEVHLEIDLEAAPAARMG